MDFNFMIPILSTAQDSARIVTVLIIALVIGYTIYWGYKFFKDNKIPRLILLGITSAILLLTLYIFTIENPVRSSLSEYTVEPTLKSDETFIVPENNSLSMGDENVDRADEIRQSNEEAIERFRNLD